MSQGRCSRIGSIGALSRLAGELPSHNGDALEHRRKLLAEFCRLLGSQLSEAASISPAGLSPRHVQTLQRLLEGDSEKQIALRLGVSPNTVHVYVKGLYRHFDVSSRGELLARFVRKH